MLYYQFRDSVERLAFSIGGVIKYGAPDSDEEALANLKAALSAFEACSLKLKKVLDSLPVELEGHPNKNFGPVVAPEDLQQVLSLMFPLVVKLDNQFPILSYFPVRLFRDKSLILLEVMNLYCEWKTYFQDEDQPVLQEPQSFIGGPLVDSENTISKEEKSFEMLFKNLRHSAKQAQRDLGREFNKNYDQI